MEVQEIQKIIENQKTFFKTGATLSVDTRIAYLKSLKNAILTLEDEIYDALHYDLGKGKSEAYFCEIALVINEIDYMLRHIRRFAKDQVVHTPLAQFHSRSFRRPSPYGTVLIMSPWNYPFMLTMDPLVDAIAAGNTVCVKPSAYSAKTSDIIEKVCNLAFDKSLVSVIKGGRKENQALLEQKFDYIFFTGSVNVGKEVMLKASQNLVPITLELGGKSPVIVDESANIALAAKRIVFGKFLNVGQTCVAPDYILVHEKVYNSFVEAVKNEVAKQYGGDILHRDDYGHIVNEKHFDRLLGLINTEKVVTGGNSDRSVLKIEPTVMVDVEFSDAVMQEEIFGPIMPIIKYSDLNETIDKVRSLPNPLALYVFSSNKTAIDKITRSINFGGGCINDTIIHLATSAMPFGGVG